MDNIIEESIKNLCKTQFDAFILTLPKFQVQVKDLSIFHGMRKDELFELYWKENKEDLCLRVLHDLKNLIV